MDKGNVVYLCNQILVDHKKRMKYWGAWVAQSVKNLTLDLGSGNDLMVHETEPHVGLCTNGAELAWDSLSLPLSLPLPCSHSLSLSLSLSK